MKKETVLGENGSNAEQESVFEEEVLAARQIYDVKVQSARDAFDAALLRACAAYCKERESLSPKLGEENGANCETEDPTRNAKLLGLGILIDLAKDQLLRSRRSKK